MPYKNKEKQKEYQRNWHQKNKPRRATNFKAKREERRRFIADSFKEKSCVDCGENNPIILDYDHIDPSKKNFSISKAVIHNTPIKEIQKEIDKCEIRCSNCHRAKTYEEHRIRHDRPCYYTGRARPSETNMDV